MASLTFESSLSTLSTPYAMTQAIKKKLRRQQRQRKLAVKRVYNAVYSREITKRIIDLQFRGSVRCSTSALLRARIAVSELSAMRLRAEYAHISIERDRLATEKAQLEKTVEVKAEVKAEVVKVTEE